MTTPSATAQSQPEAAVDAPVDRMSITISLNGPYLVNGGVPLTQEVITPARTATYGRSPSCPATSA